MLERRHLRKLDELLETAKDDEVYFARSFLNFKAFPYQEEFLRDRGRKIAACCGRQVGKTSLTAIKALHYAQFNRGKTLIIISASLRQSMILFDQILDFIAASPIVDSAVAYKSRTQVRFYHGSRIIALPCGRTGFTLRGYSVDMAILEEANFMPAKVIENVIYPMLITKRDSRLILISTPWTRDHPFYKAYSQPEQGFHVYTWPTSLNPLVSQQALDQERSMTDDLTYKMEYEGVFIDEASSYFPSAHIMECVDGTLQLLDDRVLEKKQRGVFYLGVDFGKRTDPTVILILESKNETLKLVYLKQLPLQTSYASVIGWVRRLNNVFQFARGALDQTGIGEAPLEEIQAFMPQAEGVILTAKAKQNLLTRLKLLLENRGLILPNERMLLTQMNEQQYEMTKSGGMIFRHPPNAHDDQFWALALACWAARDHRFESKLLPVKKTF